MDGDCRVGSLDVWDRDENDTAVGDGVEPGATVKA